MKPERISTPAITFKGHFGDVASAVFLKDGKRILTVGCDETVRVWDAANARELFLIAKSDIHLQDKAFYGIFGCACITFDESKIVTGHQDGFIRVWDVKSIALLKELHVHQWSINAVRFLEDDTKIITCQGSQVSIWDFETGEGIKSLEHEEPDNGFCVVCDIDVSSDGSMIVSTVTDGTARVWNLETGTEILRLVGHKSKSQLPSAVFSLDGLKILTAGQDSIVRVWDAKTGIELLQIKSHHLYLRFAAFSNDGSVIAAVGSGRQIRFWNAQTGDDLGTLFAMSWPVLHVQFYPDDSKVIATSTAGSVHAWEVPYVVKNANSQVTESSV